MVLLFFLLLFEISNKMVKLDGEDRSGHGHRRPNSRSMSASFSATQVGRPWLHWPDSGVASISRRSAFISSACIRRPDRTEPWQAIRDRTASIRPRSTPASPGLSSEASASASRMSRSSPAASTGPRIAGVSRTATAPGPKGSTASPSRCRSSAAARIVAASSPSSTISGISSTCAATPRPAASAFSRS